MNRFRHATFLASAHHLRELPPDDEPEIAFAGRSNAGKSSAINTLTHHTRLAFVSKTPGRTQLINFFALRGGGRLVDLPGYGFAEAPGAVRQHWTKTLPKYLQTRASLRGLVLVTDIRHALNPLDEQMLAWFRPTGRPVHVLLTKADKLSRSEAMAKLRTVRQRLRMIAPNYSAQLFSSLKRTGVEEAEGALAAWLEPASANAEAASVGNPA